MFLKSRATDADVVAQVLGGEREAFGLLVERYLRNVYALAYSYARNASDSEDIVQQAFINAFQRLDTLRDPKRFCPWLIQIARNVSLDHVRKAARDRERVENESGAEPAVEPDVEERELLALLRHKVAELEPDAREVLMLHYFSGLSTAEMAHHLDISREAAKKRLQRARAAFSEKFLDNLGQALQHDPPPRVNKKRIMGAVLAAGATWEAGAANAAVGVTASLLTHKPVLLAIMGIAALLGLIALLPAEDAPDSTRATAVTVAPSPVAEEPEDVPPPALAQETGQTLQVAEQVLEPEEVSPTMVSGHAIDEFGQPVPGASIVIAFGQRIDGDVTAEYHRFASRPENQYRTVTNAQGRFTVSGIRHRGWARISAGVHGMARSLVEYVSNEELTVEIVLKEGIPLLGRVLSPYGEPVSNVYVEILGTSKGNQDASVFSDASGSFQVVFFQPLEWAHVLVKSTHGDALFERVPVDTDRVTDLQLPESATISGQVRFRDGPPAAGYHVSVQSPHGMSNSFFGRATIRGTGFSYGAVTDLMGFYEIRGVFPDSTYQFVIANESGVQRSPKTELGELAPRQNLRRDFTLDALTTIKGVVVAKSNGVPVRNVGVTVIVDPNASFSDLGPPKELSALVDENGAFEYQVALSPGEYVLTPYYLHTSLSFAAEAFGKRLEFDPGQTTEATLEIDAPYSISLRVMDNNSEPIYASMYMFWRYDDAYAVGGGSDWWTDKSGRISWDGFAPFGAITLRVSAKGYLLGKSTLYEGKPGAAYPEETIVLLYNENAGIEGLAVDSEGNPLSRTQLRVQVTTNGESGHDITLITNGSGYFLNERGIPAATVQLEIDAFEPDGSLSASWRVNEFELEPNMIHDLGTVVFSEPLAQD